MSASLYGSHWLFANTPLWLLNICFFLVSLVLPALGTLKFEGKVTPFGVNVSWSGATLGDSLCLYTIMLIGWTVLQRGPDFPPWWTEGTLIRFHLGALMLSWLVWAMFTWITFDGRRGHLLDRYHDLVAAPLLTYFIISLAPVILTAGTLLEITAALTCVAVWLGLLAFDLVTGRFVQATWIKDHVVPFFEHYYK